MSVMKTIEPARIEGMKPFVLSLSKHERFHGLRQAQAERNVIQLVPDQ